MMPQSSFLVRRAGRGRPAGRRCEALLDRHEPRCRAIADPRNRAGAVRPVRSSPLRPLRDPRPADHRRTSRSMAWRPAPWPVSLAFLGDCDGDAGDVPRRAGRDGRARPAPDLRALRGFRRRHRPALLDDRRTRRGRPPATSTGSAGRSGRSARRRRCRRRWSARRASSAEPTCRGAAARGSATSCSTSCAGEVAARRLELTPEPPTPLGWRLRNLLHAVAIPVDPRRCWHPSF